MGRVIRQVLYIHPSKLPTGFRHDWLTPASPYVLAPLGITGMINLLRSHGVPVIGLNYAMEVLMDEGFDLGRWLGAQERPGLVMIDLHWYEHSFGALDIARLCKSLWPDVPILLGGITASLFADEILRRFPEVDLILRGDPEGPILKLVESLMKGNRDLGEVPNVSFRVDGVVHHNPRTYVARTPDLDKLDFVDLSFLQHGEQYYRYQSTDFNKLTGHWLCIARGCNFNCSFCGGSRAAQGIVAGRSGMVVRTPRRVAEEMEALYQAGVQQVALSHDPAVLGRDYWRRLFDEMKARGLRIGLYVEHFQVPTPEYISAFAEAVVPSQSQVALSPLSGHERVRLLNGKAFTNQAFFAALAAFRTYRIPVFVYFSLNLPGEDEKTMEQTLAMARRIHDQYPKRLLQMANMCHTIDPACPMSQNPGRYGIRVQMQTFLDYYEYCRLTAVARPEARTGLLRGFVENPAGSRSIARMADRWDALCARLGEGCHRVPSAW